MMDADALPLPKDFCAYSRAIAFCCAVIMSDCQAVFGSAVPVVCGYRPVDTG
eukprot:XP_001704956.1 Hypothetical protein GL50803_23739 [Giardia lamblia ATCC 50803]